MKSVIELAIMITAIVAIVAGGAMVVASTLLWS
jgi:hypothetical protein